MGLDVNIRPVAAPAAMVVIRPMPEAAQTAVATQLPAERVVTATEHGLPTALSARRTPVFDTPAVSKEVILDREAGEIVYMSVDDKTKQVITQYPEENRLRARAYLRALDVSMEEARRADRQA